MSNVLIPTVTLYRNDDIYAHMEYCGRVCKASEHKMNANTTMPFLKKMVKAKHWGVLEHAGIDVRDNMPDLNKLQDVSPEFGLCMSRAVLGGVRISDLLQYTDLKLEDIEAFPRDNSLITAEFSCSLATSHQLVRHRNFSFCQRSLRYTVPEELNLVNPGFEEGSEKYKRLVDSCEQAFSIYKQQLEAGVAPDEARYVLPMATATKLVMTGNLTWWFDFLCKRYYTGASDAMIWLAQQLFKLMPESIHRAAATTEIIERFKQVDDYFKKKDAYRVFNPGQA